MAGLTQNSGKRSRVAGKENPVIQGLKNNTEKRIARLRLLEFNQERIVFLNIEHQEISFPKIDGERKKLRQR